MPMSYPNTWIQDTQVPRAESPIFQHLVDTYASETNKVVSIWREFSPDAMDFKPHPRSSTVQEIMKTSATLGTPVFRRVSRHSRT
jgi:hypothetical protein